MEDNKEKSQEEMVKEAVEEAKKTAEATKEEAAEDEAKEAETEDSKESDTEEKKSGKKLFGKKDKKDKKDEKIEELTDRLTRQMAEFDNFRKRTEKEKSQMYEVGAKDIIEKILPVVDNFERGLDAVTGRRQRRSIYPGNGEGLQTADDNTGRNRGETYRSGRSGV